MQCATPVRRLPCLPACQVTFFFAAIINAFTATGVFLLFGAFCLACLVFVIAVMPETKGKSLQEIERELMAGGASSVDPSLHDQGPEDLTPQGLRRA